MAAGIFLCLLIASCRHVGVNKSDVKPAASSPIGQHAPAAQTVAAPTPARRPTQVPATAIPDLRGVRTGGITYPLDELRQIQAAVDRGERAFRYYLNPVRVVEHDLPSYGFASAPVTVLSAVPPAPAPTAHLGEDGNPECDVIVRYRGRQYWIVLNQFMRHGPAGIWSIITITPM